MGRPYQVAPLGLMPAVFMNGACGHTATRVNPYDWSVENAGPAIGDLVVGAFAGLVGPVAALTVGALTPMLVAASFWTRENVVRDYTGAVPAGT